MHTAAHKKSRGNPGINDKKFFQCARGRLGGRVGFVAFVLAFLFLG